MSVGVLSPESCSFCRAGGATVVQVQADRFAVHCHACGARGSIAPDPVKAIRIWNLLPPLSRPAVAQQCSTCRFWGAPEEGEGAARRLAYFGDCRKLPPVALRTWPQTDHRDWCGAWERDGVV